MNSPHIEAAEVFAPGEYLRDELEARGWSQTDLAEILGRPPRVVNELIAGKRGVTPETAKGLADAFGTSPHLWLNLDSAYQLRNVKDGDDRVALRARLFDKAPIKEMIRRAWIEPSKDPRILEARVLRFFEIDDLDQEPGLPFAARKSTSYDFSSPGQRAWVWRAKHLASGAPVLAAFSRANLREAIIHLKGLMGSEEGVRQVPRILAMAGVRFLVVQHLASTRIDGASFWLDARSPVVVLSLRYDRIDHFWFTVLHEIGHLLLGERELRVETDLVGEGAVAPEKKPPAERQADVFALSSLIDPSALDDFIERKSPLYSRVQVRGFAKLHHVHPGIVVGQLQHRGEVSYATFRELLVKVRGFVIESALTDGWGSHLPASVH